MAGVLEHPTLLGVVETDQLQVLAVPLIRLGPVLPRQPLRVGRQVRQRLVGHRVQRLTQQLPALLHLVGGHVVQAGVVRVLLVRLAELGVDLLENRVLRPGFARRPGLRELRQPQLETLVARDRR